MRQLFKVTWTLELAKRIEQAIKQASPKAHHEAPDLYPRPRTPDELEVMLAEFDAICELTAPAKDAEQVEIDEVLAAQAQSAAS